VLISAKKKIHVFFTGRGPPCYLLVFCRSASKSEKILTFWMIRIRSNHSDSYQDPKQSKYKFYIVKLEFSCLKGNLQFKVLVNRHFKCNVVVNRNWVPITCSFKKDRRYFLIRQRKLFCWKSYVKLWQRSESDRIRFWIRIRKVRNSKRSETTDPNPIQIVRVCNTDVLTVNCWTNYFLDRVDK